jgi:DNA-binding NarL/FixJ family response regulator
MARVLALIPDLLFGSRVQSSLAAAGHGVELVADSAQVARRLHAACGVGEEARRGRDAAAGAQRRDAGEALVVVVDLTNADLDGPTVVEELSMQGLLARARVLGFYAHVDTKTRERAERAGFDLVVPRSRMAREGAELVSRLAGGASASGAGPRHGPGVS